ncbi:MlaD family protein [Nocardia africana]|uniref:Virulence factor Mce family protein n=1 Tax=Nocardia africana TaxID=134964 RepID=A0A378X196_9NOCA|nr:MlaD family protein [Nocardia africana]MCC3312271.1 MlaD family protein [Nocardia africana]SUA46421.1 virulence factor Mce family protein [Nocardia africana]
MKWKRTTAVVGAAGLVAAVVIAAGSRFDRGIVRADDGYCALMPDTVGLYPGNPVTQMGYPVGKVDHVDPQGGYVRVTFELDPGRRYPADVKAVTRSKSILADRSLELVGNYRSGAQLEAGHCIALKDTATPKSLSEITGSAADFLGQLTPGDNTKALTDAVDGLAKALAGQGGNAHQLMVNAQDAMASPDRLVSDIGSILFNLSPLTTQALADWNSLHHTAEVLPTDITSLTFGAWPGVDGLIRGMGPLIAVLYEIQSQYGDAIWPTADHAADIIRLAASHANDIRDFLGLLPGVAAFMTNTAHGRSVQWQPPTVDGTNVLDLALEREHR